MPSTKLDNAQIARCEIEGYRSGQQEISLDHGKFSLELREGQLGIFEIPAALRDLLNLAFIVFQIERMQQGFSGGNRPNFYRLFVHVNSDTFCETSIVNQVQEILRFMGSATWQICPVKGALDLLSDPSVATVTDAKKIDQITLFSGGLDSTCGLGMLSQSKETTLPVSFYIQQKTLQRKIALERLSYPSLVQITRRADANPGSRKRSYYRSFFFLSLAALVASSWSTTRILQIENGVLATSVSPGQSWYMTRHAHPDLHSKFKRLLIDITGDDWRVENPALFMTKRELFQNAANVVGSETMFELANQTETCWFHRSPTIPGGTKENNRACGLCIPCIIRRTALQDVNYAYDLATDEDARNDERKGRSFRDYFGFCNEILQLDDDMARFYRMLPSVSREVLSPDNGIALADLHGLFVRFANEFMETFAL